MFTHPCPDGLFSQYQIVEHTFDLLLISLESVGLVDVQPSVYSEVSVPVV